MASYDADILKAQAGDLEARNQVIIANMGLIHMMAKQYWTLERDDVAQEGVLVLMQCIEKFDMARGFQFTSYAVNALRNHFNRLYNKQRPSDSLNECPEPWMTIEYNADEKTLAKRLVAMLSERDRVIVQNWMMGSTFEEIGKELGFSKQRAHQLWKQIIEKLRMKVKL